MIKLRIELYSKYHVPQQLEVKNASVEMIPRIGEEILTRTQRYEVTNVIHMIDDNPKVDVVVCCQYTAQREVQPENATLPMWTDGSSGH